jgi:copper transporter 1
MFAGSCIGVILLVMSLELLRRAVKEYDVHLVRKHATSTTTEVVSAAVLAREGYHSKSREPDSATIILPADGFRPSVLEQALRALLHTVQFAVAYFIMLLAMYYNGYIIICIFIGAFLGVFVFQWENLGR